MSITRKTVYALLIIATCISYLFLWAGLSNIVTSCLIYFSVFYTLYFLLSLLFKRKFTPNWRVLFVSSCVSLLILEIGLRIGTDKYHSYPERNGSFWYNCPFAKIRMKNFIQSFDEDDVRLLIGQKSVTLIEQNSEFSYPHAFNSMGFRDQELELSNINSKLVIAGFGDSFTEGVGAPQDSTWVKLLDGELNDCSDNLLTVNAGRNDSDIIYESYKLKHLVAKTFMPELAVFVINTSDIHDLIVRGGVERFVSKNKIVHRAGPWWKYLYSFSYSWRAIAHEIMDVNWALYNEKDYSRLESQAKDLIYSTIINDIVPFTEEHNIQTLFVFGPMEHELLEDSFAFTDLSADLARQHVNVLDLHPVIQKLSKENVDYYWDIDLHCNSQGYLLWSKAIAAEIREKSLINCE